MSALFGLIYLNGRPVEQATLKSMGQAVADCCYDGCQHRIDGNAGLGCCCRRNLPDPSHGLHCMASGPDGSVIVSDARIDNCAEFADRLNFSAGIAPSPGNGDLLLAAYRRWGREIPRHLIGDFAFAIWDRRNNSLFAARDPMGVRPFYYFLSDELFAFASEIKMLLALDSVAREINRDHLARFLLRQIPPAQSTWYRNIFRLPAGHTLCLRDGRLDIDRYWSIMDCPDVRLADDREYEEAFREFFVKAVQCRIDPAAPVGCALSGGLDSSSIVCVATRQRKLVGKLHTFSAIFPSLDPALLAMIDEREYIQAVLDENDVHAHMIRADLLDPLADLDAMLRIMDGPYFAPNLYIHLAMYRKARQHGVRFFLDGIDGDTVVSYGFERLPHLLLCGRMGKLFRELRAIQAMYPGSGNMAKLCSTYALKPLLRPAWQKMRCISDNARRRYAEQLFPFSSDFLDQIELAEIFFDSLSWRPSVDPVHEHRQGISSPVFQDLLEITGKVAARFGLDDRYPFFDTRLLEFCAGLPPDQKLRAGWTRSIMRRALRGYLPKKIRLRTNKARLSPNFNAWLSRNNEILSSLFNDGVSYLGPYIDMQRLHRKYRMFLAAPQQNGSIPIELFAAVSLYRWFKKESDFH